MGNVDTGTKQSWILVDEQRRYQRYQQDRARARSWLLAARQSQHLQINTGS